VQEVITNAIAQNNKAITFFIIFAILMIIIDTCPKHEAWHCDATS